MLLPCSWNFDPDWYPKTIFLSRYKEFQPKRHQSWIVWRFPFLFDLCSVSSKNVVSSWKSRSYFKGTFFILFYETDWGLWTTLETRKPKIVRVGTNNKVICICSVGTNNEVICICSVGTGNKVICFCSVGTNNKVICICSVGTSN